MDQESLCYPAGLPSASTSTPVSTRPRRRRRTIALAAAAVLSSASSSAPVARAYAPSSPAAAWRPSPPAAGGDRDQRALPPGAVSLLDAPPAAGTKDGRRLRREGRAIGGIDLPREFLGAADFDGLGGPAFLEEGGPPAIDSEILYEGITRSAAPPKTATAAADAPRRTTRDVVVGGGGGRGKSSTMPGFAKDGSLDVVAVASRSPARDRARSRPRIRSKPLARSSASRLRRKPKPKSKSSRSDALYRRSPAVPDSMSDYAREIHAVARVTPREERELGARTQEAARLRELRDAFRDEAGRDPTDDEWRAAAGMTTVRALREAIEEGARAKNRLVASNLRMVQRVVNLYIRNGLGSEYNAGDLMQDGTMALIRAAEKYEPDRGFRFSTYAMYWIRSAVKRSQTAQSRIVAVPQRIHETHKRLARHEARLREEGKEPTKDELADACDISVLQLDRCRRAMAQVTFSLDSELENGLKPNSPNTRRDTLHDILEGRADETDYGGSQRRLVKEHLIGSLRRHLSPHEVDLLLLRYGLMDERAVPRGKSGPLTIAELSKLVGLKPDKVRRIIINSQKQLRHLMREWEDFEQEFA